jgi:hypothetical protein
VPRQRDRRQFERLWPAFRATAAFSLERIQQIVKGSALLEIAARSAG